MASVKQLLGDVFGKFIFREVTVHKTTDVSSRFRRLDLVGTSLQGVSFTPGDKVQVMLEDGPRTYTPFSFDATRGAMSFLVYVHGDTPGARWGRDAKVGDTARVFGPRGSIALPSLATGPVVLFGDETSFAVARALKELRGDAAPSSFVFEVSDREASKLALDHVEVAADGVVVRRNDGGHLAEVEQLLRRALSTSGSASLVLTGKAQSIQTLRSGLRAQPAPHTVQKTKAYWAPGKRGLD